MTVNQYKVDVEELIKARRGNVSETTLKSLERRYNRMERDLCRLKEDGKIKTYNPSKISAEDVKEFILYRKSKKVNGKNIHPTNVNHDISALNQLCLFRKNAAVEQCLNANIGLRPRVTYEKIDPLSEDTYNLILEKYYGLEEGLSNIRVIRPYVMVLMYIGTGARNKELRLAKISDLNIGEGLIRLEHVKGEGTYGRTRNIPIPDELMPVVKNYVSVRKRWLISQGIEPETVSPLFFRLGGDYGYLSSNAVRVIKKRVEEGIGVKFKIQDCRRTFGQHYVNKDVNISDVSYLMGHGTTRTTELYYCRKSETEVINGVRGKW